VPAKVGSGEADLQAAYLGFSNYTFLKQAEHRSGFEVRRWTPAKGARIALFPNLNHSDPVWRDLFRKVDFRRALSLGINREDINNAIFYGLAAEGNNTVLKESPLYRDEYRMKWAQYDPDQANRLLDGLGLTQRDGDGIRLLPDGRKLQMVVETAGEDSEQSDVLELIRDDWQKIGVALFIKPTQREVFYNRIKAGSTQMAIWTGLENGLPNPTHTPAELAPLSGEQYQWPAWGLWAETQGQIGEEPDLEPVRRLMALKAEWGKAETPQRQEEIWHEMLSLWGDQVFTIGVVSGVDQIVTVSNRLRNVPKRGIYNFNPGAFFGMYHPDTFWLDDSQAQAALGNPK
jgi:peptide/nickel transport system substrate-binding protein